MLNNGLDMNKRAAALLALRTRMLALVPNVPEDDAEERDVSDRRLRAVGQLERMALEVRP